LDLIWTNFLLVAFRRVVANANIDIRAEIGDFALWRDDGK